MRVDDNAGDAFAEAIVKGLVGANIDASVETRDAHYGQVAPAIAAAADDLGADMIVIGSRGRSNVTSIALGSVSHKLLHLARRPVLVVPSV
jgi:nucleotide-binding universal stress UspA family protein